MWIQISSIYVCPLVSQRKVLTYELSWNLSFFTNCLSLLSLYNIILLVMLSGNRSGLLRCTQGQKSQNMWWRNCQLLMTNPAIKTRQERACQLPCHKCHHYYMWAYLSTSFNGSVLNITECYNLENTRWTNSGLSVKQSPVKSKVNSHTVQQTQHSKQTLLLHH